MLCAWLLQLSSYHVAGSPGPLHVALQQLASGDHFGAEAAVLAALDAGLHPVELTPGSRVPLVAHHILGHARYRAGDPVAAAEHFKVSLAYQPHRASEWANLAAALKQSKDMEGALEALHYAVFGLRGAAFAGNLLSVQLWTGQWQALASTRALVASLLRAPGPQRYTVSATEVLDLPVSAVVPASLQAAQRVMPPPGCPRAALQPPGRGARLTLVFVGGDWGQHPVPELSVAMLSSLCAASSVHVLIVSTVAPVRGALQVLGAAGCVVSSTAGRQPQEVTAALRAARPHVALDLGGHTGGASGLRVLCPRLAPLQVGFLGYPATSAVPWVGGQVFDADTLPAEALGSMTEASLWLAQPYLPTSHARLHAYVPLLPRAPPRRPSLPGCSAPLTLGVLSGQQKIDPGIFSVWMHTLSASPCAALSLLLNTASGRALPSRLRRMVAAHGVHPHRVAFMQRQHPADHVRGKSRLDLVLDTPLKGGHASALDALWAGVPVLSVWGDLPHARSAAALCVATGACPPPQRSLRGYAHAASTLAARPTALAALRGKARAARASSTLWDPPPYAAAFAQLMEAASDALRLQGGWTARDDSSQWSARQELAAAWGQRQSWPGHTIAVPAQGAKQARAALQAARQNAIRAG